MCRSLLSLEVATDRPVSGIPNFKIHLVCTDIAALARRADKVAAFDLIASLDFKLFRVRIDGHWRAAQQAWQRPPRC